MLYTESMVGCNVGTEQGSSKDQWARWYSDSSRPTSTLDEMCDVVHILCCDCPLDGLCPGLGFNIGLLTSPIGNLGEDLGDSYGANENSNRNIDQLGQDLSDSDGLILLNPTAVIPRMPLRFSTSRSETQAEVTVPLAKDGESEESEPEGEAATESETEPVENDSDSDDDCSNENENVESEREHSEVESENDSSAGEDEEEEEEEEEEADEQEDVASRSFTPLSVSTPMMSSASVDTSVASSPPTTTTTIQLMKMQRMGAAPVVHHTQVQANSDQTPQHAVYQIGAGAVTTTTPATVTTVTTATTPIEREQEPTGRHDNPYPKPAFSYSCLITLALKNSQTGSLPVSEIYNFMCRHFPYFKTAPSGWKNSVRHNLSLNKSFQKIEKPLGNGSQRKGCLWAIRPSKVAKMYEEVQKRSRKDPIAIKQAMIHPEHLELLERGEMKFIDGHDAMHEETESYADGSVASVGSVVSTGSGLDLAGQSIAYEEEEEEEEEEITSQEHVATNHPPADDYQEDSHEAENSNANVVVEQLYNDLDIESFPSADQITLPYQLYQLSPSPKRLKTNNSGSTQSTRVVFQVHEESCHRRTPVQPQSGSLSPRYVLVNIDEV